MAKFDIGPNRDQFVGVDKARTLTEIQRLKNEKNALILAHFYEDGDIQDLADFVGDSYFLAKKGKEAPQNLIVLCGVVFMGESVKILSPHKRVLVPDLHASCSLVHGSPYDRYLRWRAAKPEAVAVTYINSSADVKAISDVIVTSSNAKKIIESIPADREILFGPDQNLGHWLSREMKRPLTLWPGACEVHVLFSARKLQKLIEEHPGAVVIAHPECDEALLQFADVIGATSRLLEEVQNNPAKKFIVATETGILHQMKKSRPDVELIQAPAEDETCSCNDCPYMKLNTLEKIRICLEKESPEVHVAEDIAQRAQVSLERMLEVTAGRAVTWPAQFRM